MNSSGVYGTKLWRIPSNPPGITSSSLAGGIKEENPSTWGTPDAPSATSKPLPPEESGSRYLAGKISIDLHYRLEESYSSTVTRKTADGYMQLRKSVYRSFEANYSFDFSFLARLDATSQKLGGLSPEVLGEFVQTASDLLSLSETDLQEFTEATDNLFNELKGAVGGDGEMLDGIRDLLKNSVSSFIRSVKDGAENIRTIAPGAGEMKSLDYAGLKKEASRMFDDGLYEFLRKLMQDSSRLLEKQHTRMLEDLQRLFDKSEESQKLHFDTLAP